MYVIKVGVRQYKLNKCLTRIIYDEVKINKNIYS